MNRVSIGVLICWVLLLATPSQSQGGPAESLQKGWRLYNKGRLSDAASAFENASHARKAEISRDAWLGLAYVRIRQSRFEEAEKFLDHLAALGHRPHETLLRLVEVRVALGRFESATQAAEKLTEPSRTEKKREIAEAKLQADFDHGVGSEETAITFLKTHQTDLAACLRPDLFFRVAGSAKSSAISGDTYQALLKCPLNKALRGSLLEDLAWYHYNRKAWDSAEIFFIHLLKERPNHRGAALGLGYVRLNTGRASNALDPLKKAGFPDDPEILKFKALVYKNLGWRCYNQGDFNQAASYAHQAHTISPKNEEASLLMAWIDLKQGKTDQALQSFESIYRDNPSPEMAIQLLDAQLAANRPDAARKSAETMASSEIHALRKRAADFFHDRKESIRAAHITDDPNTCYANADTAMITMENRFRYRDGDPGTSKLYEYGLPIEGEKVVGERTRLFIGVTPKVLKSGSAPSNPPMGTFYRFLDGASQRGTFTEEKTVVIPQMGFSTEGKWRWSGQLATTPIGGEISPAVTGELGLKTDFWRMSIHRLSVTESILSTIGIKDPYENQSWGRIVRSGIGAGGTLPIGPVFWISGSLGGDLYEGRHVWDNSRINTDFSAGGTWKTPANYALSAGLFLSAQHFRRNSNFYTYGHGGYYSPNVMTMTGPFLRYTAPPCGRYWFDINTAVGWLHEETEAAPHYPLLDPGDSQVGDSARSEALGWYEGQTSDGVGYSIEVDIGYLLTDRLAIRGFASGEHSSKYSEWTTGVGLSWFFKPQKGFMRALCGQLYRPPS